MAPFLALGVPREEITFGHVVAEECERLGLSLDDYLDHYDEALAQPFPGVEELLGGLERWAVCSNKHPRSGRAELTRLGWEPEVSLFADTFGGPKRLGPVLDALALPPSDVVFVGDTAHDRACATDLGITFVLAAWNPRAVSTPDDVVATAPGDISRWLDPRRPGSTDG